MRNNGFPFYHIPLFNRIILYPVHLTFSSKTYRYNTKGDRPNILTVAWAGTVCTNPPMVSISVRPERYSHAIIEETGEFVINLVNEPLTRACDYCGVRSGRDVDKFSELHLTASPAAKLKAAPAIAQSPVSIECRVVQKLALGSHDMFLAEVEAIEVDEAYLDEKGKFELNKTGLIAYSHGEYFTLGRKAGSFGFSVKKKPSGKKRDRLSSGQSSDRS